jgi:hypothetical protein
VPEHLDPVRLALAQTPFREGMAVVRGPDWKWGRQDGGGQGEHAEGRVTLVRDNGWTKVLWGNGHEDSYRIGAEDGAFDVQPAALEIAEDSEPLPVAVQAIVEGLEGALRLLRERLHDRAFQHCLGVVWSACVSVLETCLHDDVRPSPGPPLPLSLPPGALACPAACCK